MFRLDGSDPANPTFPKACDMVQAPTILCYIDSERVFAVFSGLGFYKVYSKLDEASCSEDMKMTYESPHWIPVRGTSVHGNGLYMVFNPSDATIAPVLYWIDLTTGERTLLLSFRGVVSNLLGFGDVMFISYVTSYNGTDFEIYNVTDFMNPVLIRSQFLGLRFISMASVGDDGIVSSAIKNWWDHVVVLARSGASWEDGVDVVYMHRLYKANIDTVSVIGTDVYVATIFTNKIYGWDLSDIRNPQLIFSHQLQTGASKLFANQGYGYGWSEYAGDNDQYNRGFIEVFKLFNPTSAPPTPSPTLPPPTHPPATNIPSTAAPPTNVPFTDLPVLVVEPIANSTLIPLVSHNFVRSPSDGEEFPPRFYSQNGGNSMLYVLEGEPGEPSVREEGTLGQAPDMMIYSGVDSAFALYSYMSSYNFFRTLSPPVQNASSSYDSKIYFPLRSMFVRGNGMYLVLNPPDQSSQLPLLQWVDKETGVAKTVCTLPTAVADFAVIGDVMFVSYYGSYEGNDFAIYSISDFMNPVLLHSQLLGFWFFTLSGVGEGLAGAVKVTSRDQFAVLARSGVSWADGVDVVAMYRFPGANIVDTTVSGTTVYVPTMYTKAIYGVDVSDVRNPQITFAHTFESSIMKLYVNQGYGYGWSEYNASDGDEYNRGYIEVFKFFSNTPAPPTLVPTQTPPTAIPATSVPTDTPAETAQPTTLPDVPTTDAPATAAPATVVPGSDAPATDAPATDAPTTHAPATASPTNAPVTSIPMTDIPQTDAPETDVPATDAPTTHAPATVPPTNAPVTSIPMTDIPQTDAPETDVPTTNVPHTISPTPQPTWAPPLPFLGPRAEKAYIELGSISNIVGSGNACGALYAVGETLNVVSVAGDTPDLWSNTHLTLEHAPCLGLAFFGSTQYAVTLCGTTLQGISTAAPASLGWQFPQVGLRAWLVADTVESMALYTISATNDTLALHKWMWAGSKMETLGSILLNAAPDASVVAAIGGHVVYLGIGNTLRVFDVSYLPRRHEPVLPLRSTLTHLVVHNGLLVGMTTDSSLVVLNVTIAEYVSVQEVGSFRISRGTLVVGAERVYVMHDTSVSVFTIESGGALVLSSQLETRVPTVGVVEQRGYLYVAAASGRILVFRDSISVPPVTACGGGGGGGGRADDSKEAGERALVVMAIAFIVLCVSTGVILLLTYYPAAHNRLYCKWTGTIQKELLHSDLGSNSGGENTEMLMRDAVPMC